MINIEVSQITKCLFWAAALCRGKWQRKAGKLWQQQASPIIAFHLHHHLSSKCHQRLWLTLSCESMRSPRAAFSSAKWPACETLAVRSCLHCAVSIVLTRLSITICSVLFHVVVQDVPSMGDSITEGVVESYVKSKSRFSLRSET